MSVVSVSAMCTEHTLRMAKQAGKYIKLETELNP